jgi:hypothetical protein
MKHTSLQAHNRFEAWGLTEFTALPVEFLIKLNIADQIDTETI